ncbi:hypothetical protein D3C80_1726590 [compost metagenome]
MPCCDRPGCGGTHICEVAVIEKKGLHQSGPCAEEDHQPVEARQTEIGIVEEAGADLDGETVKTRHISRLYIHLATKLWYIEPQDRRHGDRFGCERCKGLLHALDCRQVELHDSAQIFFG